MTTQQLHDNRIRIGRRLAELRESAGMTQQQVADITGILRPHVARAEAGKYNISIDVLGRIADALGCRIGIDATASSSGS